MREDEGRLALQANVGKAVTAATLTLWTIKVHFQGAANACDEIFISFQQGWQLFQNGKRLLILDEEGCFEPEFDLDSDWTEVEAARERALVVVSQLVGQTLESISLGEDLIGLRLTFSTGFVLERDLEELEWAKWTYRDRRSDLHFEISSAGLEDLKQLPDDIFARRHILFEKDGKQLTGKVTVLTPRPTTEGSLWSDVVTRAMIQAPFGDSQISVSGVDGIQSIRLCFEQLQRELDRIARAHNARAYHFDPNSSAIYRPEDDFHIIQSLLRMMLEKALSRKENSEVPQTGDNLDLLRRCLRRVELIRASGTEE